MSNLLDNSKWSLQNATQDKDVFNIVNGSIYQSISLPKSNKYKIGFNCLALTNLKSYFLLKATVVDKIHSYLIPINFIGTNSIELNLVPGATMLQIKVIGNLRIKELFLDVNDVLTEEQKESLDKVTSNSDGWDKILDITNDRGNVITEKLEGHINTAINNVIGGGGTIVWEDGNLILRDKNTDSDSTWCMLLGAAGFLIANGKNADGSWNWRTFGTGAGFVADEIVTGTLNSIMLNAVTIIASELTGGVINGATFNGGKLSLTGKDNISIHMEGGKPLSISEVDVNGIFKKYYYQLYINEGDGAYQVLSTPTHSECLRIQVSDDAYYGQPVSQLISNAAMELRSTSILELNSKDDIMAYARYDIRFMCNDFYVNGDIKNIAMSELEVRNMELENELRQQGIKQSELEVCLMERGVL